MTSKAARGVMSVAAFAVALSVFLFYQMQGSADYYKRVDEVMVNPHEWIGKSMNLHGFVVDGSVKKRPNSLDYRFYVKNNDQVVLATYTGIVPDTFKDGAEVVLTGTLSADGFHVKPNGVTAKCPSRYEAGQKPEGQ